jgi:acyl-coenzyme A synthetase/AMP-(fatty) acid ligase
MNPGRPFSGPEAAIAALLTAPLDPEQEFIHGGATFAEVYGMASWLRAACAGRNERGVVCLATEDRALMAAALLASLAGGPVLLLPHAFSGQALSGMQEATGFTGAITDTGAPRDFPAGIEVIHPPWGETGPDLRSFPASFGEELLRLYTGGSTGAPQLWSKTGINIFAEALFLAEHFDVSQRDRIAATISPYHIYGLLYSVALPLVSGATVLPGTPSFPEEIIRTVADQEATILVSVPAHYRALRARASSLGSSLRLAFSSAGMLDIEDNTEFCRHNGAGIVEVYGSTETGGIGLRNRSRSEEGFTPYPTIAWKISDQRLHVRSPYLSLSLPQDAEGFFITGDKVTSCPPEGFQLKGRADSITKVAGKRVDLEEIRALIKQQPNVADCVVLALAEAGGREHRIVALVAGEAVDTEALRRVLAVRFEPYALPRAIKTVSRLPMKENGKYDRAAIVRLFQP